MPVLRAARRLLTLPVAEVGDLVTAQLVLLAARRARRRKPLGQLLRPLGDVSRPASDTEDPRVARLATAIDRMSRFGLFRPTCLDRAIALDWIAQRLTGGSAAVRIGVMRYEDSLFAHAWIEYGGHVVGDESVDVRRFVPLHDFSALPQ